MKSGKLGQSGQRHEGQRGIAEGDRQPYEETREAMKIVEEGIGERLHNKKEVVHYDSPAKEKLRRIEQAVIEEYRLSKVLSL
jgi:hypothetical protein